MGKGPGNGPQNKPGKPLFQLAHIKSIKKLQKVNRYGPLTFIDSFYSMNEVLYFLIFSLTPHIDFRIYGCLLRLYGVCFYIKYELHFKDNY